MKILFAAALCLLPAVSYGAACDGVQLDEIEACAAINGCFDCGIPSDYTTKGEWCALVDCCAQCADVADFVWSCQNAGDTLTGGGCDGAAGDAATSDACDGFQTDELEACAGINRCFDCNVPNTYTEKGEWCAIYECCPGCQELSDFIWSCRNNGDTLASGGCDGTTADAATDDLCDGFQSDDVEVCAALNACWYCDIPALDEGLSEWCTFFNCCPGCQVLSDFIWKCRNEGSLFSCPTKGDGAADSAASACAYCIATDGVRCEDVCLQALSGDAAGDASKTDCWNCLVDPAASCETICVDAYPGDAAADQNACVTCLADPTASCEDTCASAFSAGDIPPSCDGKKIPLLNYMRQDASCDGCIGPETCVDDEFDPACCAACSAETTAWQGCCDGSAEDIPVSCDGDKIPLTRCMTSDPSCDGCLLPETCVDEDYDETCCAACATQAAAFSSCCAAADQTPTSAPPPTDATPTEPGDTPTAAPPTTSSGFALHAALPLVVVGIIGTIAI